MAVSMNAGGYMRSDFMISDAAIPMRMEELDAESMVKFAELIGGLDGTADVTVTQAAEPIADGSVQIPEKVQQLAEKIAEGEIELESLPKELITNDLFKAVAALRKQNPSKGEQKDEALKPEIAEQAVQLAAQLAAPVQMDIPDDRTEELSAIAAAFAVGETDEVTKAVKEFTVPEENPAVVLAQPETETPVSEPSVEQMQFSLKQPETDVPLKVQPEQPENAQANPESVVPEKAEAQQETAIRAAAQVDPEKLTTEQIEVLNQAAEKGEISKPEVKSIKGRKREQADIPAVKEKSESAPETRPNNVVNDRVKNAADELEMLRNAKARPVQAQPAQQAADAKPVTVDTAETGFPVMSEKADAQPSAAKPQQVQPENAEFPQVKADSAESISVKAEIPEKLQPVKEQPDAAQNIAPDLPIVITRDNGEQVEVRPREIIAQATAKLVDTAKEMTEDKAEYSLVLNPEELGKITVKLTKAADGAVSVTIAAENARTQRILEQHSEVMQNDLRNNGIRLESWQTVNDAQQNPQAQDYNGSSKNPYYRDETPHKQDDADETSFADIMAAM